MLSHEKKISRLEFRVSNRESESAGSPAEVTNFILPVSLGPAGRDFFQATLDQKYRQNHWHGTVDNGR